MTTIKEAMTPSLVAQLISKCEVVSVVGGLEDTEKNSALLMQKVIELSSTICAIEDAGKAMIAEENHA